MPGEDSKRGEAIIRRVAGVALDKFSRSRILIRRLAEKDFDPAENFCQEDDRQTPLRETTISNIIIVILESSLAGR